MTRPDALPRPLVLSAVSSATTWLALTAWRGFVTYPWHFLLPAAGLAVVLALTSGLLATRLPSWVVGVVEVLVAALAVSWVASGRVVPLTGRSVADAVGAGLGAARSHPAPIGPHVASVTPLLFVGAALFLVLGQWLAVRLHRPPLAGLALLAIFAVPSGITDRAPTLLSFVGAAVGFLVLLAVETHDERDRWGGREATGVRSTVRAAVPIGVGAVLVALLVALVVPVPDPGLLDLSGPGPTDITIHKPIVDMRHRLSQGSDVPLVDIRTTEPDPSYLRIAVLNRFTGTEWSSGDRTISADHRADGDVPLSPGLSPDVPRTAYPMEVHALRAFDSTWLPTAYPVSQIDASGDWRYDPATMDFMAAGGGSTAGLSYSMTAERLDLGDGGTWFQDAPAGAAPAEDLDVPSTVPRLVHALARRLTKGAHDDFERARLLQDFFRVSGGFRYSLTRAPGGPVGQSMVQFLEPGPDGRIGYCEQFASAMALMARSVGIPARVAVGFLEPQRTGPDTWEYTSHDLHAWPELYFEGAGWVRFEPTPAQRTGEAPAYSALPSGHGPARHGHHHRTAPRRHQAKHPSSRPSPRHQSSPPARAHQSRPIATSPAPHRAAGGPGGVVRWLATVVAALVLLALAVVAPSTIRRRRRTTRLGGGPEDLWTEILATAADLGIACPPGRSPREVAAVL
ncbi:MAG: DUF3488 and transglutaminase-like domain-containing protein, partial [Nocardioidaceae bacterium]|nr:DUF3488 and transglutaminase-like domain-containing protein [Nocardioidaceae bacterium]